MPFDAGSIVARLELNSKQWEQSIARVKADQSTLSGYVLRNEQTFKSLGKAIGIAGGAIVATFGLMIKKTADAGDQFDDLRQRTGIAANVLSSFTLAVNKTDMGMTGFATALKFLANNMADANSGAAASVTKFAQLGVAFKNVDGTLRPLDQVMLDVADKFKAMPDGAQKSALAVDLFGRAGTGMIHMLNLGRDGLQAEMDKAKELGLVFTNEAAGAADKFSESLVDLKGGLQGVGIQIGTALLPAVQELVDKVTGITAKVVAWAQEHPGLAAGLSKVAMGLGLLMTAIGPVLYALPSLIKGLQAARLIASQTFIFTFALAGVAIVAAGVAKMIDDFKRLRLEGETTAEAIRTMFLKFNPFKNLSREGMGEFLAGMDEARDKTISVKGATILLGDAFKAIKGAIEAGAITPLANLMGIFKDFGLKTRTELTAELVAAEAALTLLKGSIEKTPGQVEVLEGKITALKEAINGSGEAAKKAAEEKKKFAESIQSIFDRASPEAAALRQVRVDQEELNKATRTGVGDKTALAQAMDHLVQQEVRLLTTTPQIKDALEALAATNAKDVVPGLIDMADHFPDIPAAAQPAIEQTKNYFDGLFNDIASGFGNTIQQWLSGATTFKDFMLGLWGNIKDAFFRMIGEMIAEWTIKFVAKLIKDAAEVGTSIAKSIGGALGGVGGAAGKMAGSFLSAASSIANIVTAVASVVSLLKSPPTGAGDGMGRVVERQDQQTAILGSILEFQRNDERWGWQTSIKVLENIAYTQFKAANAYLQSMDITLKGLKGASSGAVSTQTELMVVHGTRSDPEYIARASQLNAGRLPQAAGGGQARAANVNLTFNIKALDGADVISATRRVIIPELQRFYRHGGQIPASAVGGM